MAGEDFPRRAVRCAVYTRKSTDEGLDQAFNSLDAQREACEAYIASQRHEGWTCSTERYDDGGFSGGSMDRPALKQLLADVASGQIDVVVLYKIDRLTRALSDFARIVDVLDQAEASFVSVTQAFNTTTSMGRLTLNVLLSFAQFEREVGAERVRDKIAASKKKGMWMGGVCPLGYDVRDRALVVNALEAETVRLIFELYLKLGSVLALEAELRARGIWSKRRTSRSGEERGGKPFSRGALYLMLRNVLYVARVAHRGQNYAGQHQAIVDEAIFTRAQRLLDGNAVGRRAIAGGAGDVPILAGLLFDEHGRRMSPSHTSKGVKRYRYYVSRDDDPRWADQPLVRVPAGELENLVVARMQALLMDSRALYDICEARQLSASELSGVLERAKALSNALSSASPGERTPIMRQLVSRISLNAEEIRITGGLHSLCAGQHQPLCFDLLIRSRLIRRTKEVRLIVPPSKEAAPRHDPGLIKLLVRAHQVRRRFERCSGNSVAALASELGCNLDYCTVLLKLSFLSPWLTSAILEGRQPQQLTRQELARVRSLPTLWHEQMHDLASSGT